MELSEFRQLTDICRKCHNVLVRYTATAYFIFQFHMIARLDDVYRFRRADLTPNIEFPFALKSKMRWSKNVLEERDSPDQIILGAMDPSFCPILALALHLEHPKRLGGAAAVDDQSLFCIKKERVSALFRELTSNVNFNTVSEGKIGTHSIRKLPVMFARRNGCSRDDVDSRGRWKANKRIVDTYIDTCIPYPDAKVASVLCIGGAIKYEVRPESLVTPDFILTFVSPSIMNVFPREVALVLGTALLWAYHDHKFSQLLPQDEIDPIKTRVARLGGSLDPNENPV